MNKRLGSAFGCRHRRLIKAAELRENREPGEHAEESVDYLSCEGHAHLDSQSLKQRQEEGQHLVRHI